jgi:hypothetical protein
MPGRDGMSTGDRIGITTVLGRVLAPLAPVVTFSLDAPDGTTVSRAVTAPAAGCAAAKVRFSTDGIFTDEFTGKPVANVLVYEFEDGTVCYRITFRRRLDLVRTKFVDLLTGSIRMLARLACFDGAYLRFGGTVTLERFEGGEVAETVSQDAAVWELMYFGHAP